MRLRIYSLWFGLALWLFLSPAITYSMDLYHYSLDSLVYLSTDIVIADLSKDASGNFTATVTESLYGTVLVGQKLDTLTPFLRFFHPLDNGQRVILFLDRRPRQYDFFHQDAAKSPFAVPPSGVFLIDEYEHVHQYFQQNNPGPYVAQGYTDFLDKAVPTKEQDLALPSLDEVRAQIVATIKSIVPIHAILDQPVTADEAPTLVKLLADRPRIPETCRVGIDAIASDISEKIRSLNDPELLLSTWHLDGGGLSAVPFVQDGNRQKDLRATRVNFLIETLKNRKKDLSVRIASLEILLDLSSFHSGAQTGPSKHLPIDAEWLAPSADQIIATSKAIFDDPAEDGQLRALGLGFLDVQNPQSIADIRRVYIKTRSPELRFAIEKAFLDVSDELYQTLHPFSGPVASIVELAPEQGCPQAPDNQVTFIIRFYSTRAFDGRGSVVTAGRIVLRNTKSGEVSELKDVRSMGGHYGRLDGVLLFKLDKLPDLPAGIYTLGMEYAHQFNVLYSPMADVVPSVGHTITIAITDSPNGRHVSIPSRANETNRRNPAAERELAEYILDLSPSLPAAPRRDPNFRVVYTVVGLTLPGTGPRHTEKFQFTAQNFITSRIKLSASQLDSCVDCIQSGTSVEFFPKGTLPLRIAADSVRFTGVDGIWGWIFAPGAFSAPGTYAALNDPPYITSDVATMTVRVLRATPETITRGPAIKCLYLWRCAILSKRASRTAEQ